MKDLERVRQLIKQHGNARRAALAFNAEMERAGVEYRMDITSTMQRISRGEAKAAIVALARLTLDAQKVDPNGRPLQARREELEEYEA